MSSEYMNHKLKSSYFYNKCEYITRADTLIKACESPIEELLAIELAKYSPLYFDIFTDGRVSAVNIGAQKEIMVDNRKYRADFLIYVKYSTKADSYVKNFVIECDGHNFHEKTKEQVVYDNLRQRDLQRAGYTVIRFSGSEIYTSPQGCVRDIIGMILAEK